MTHFRQIPITIAFIWLILFTHLAINPARADLTYPLGTLDYAPETQQDSTAARNKCEALCRKALRSNSSVAFGNYASGRTTVTCFCN